MRSLYEAGPLICLPNSSPIPDIILVSVVLFVFWSVSSVQCTWWPAMLTLALQFEAYH